MKFASLSERVSLLPSTWYYVCSSRSLRADATSPFEFKVAHRTFVAFRTPEGRAVVLDGRCCHLGSRLGAGTVQKGCIQCAFHGWEFNQKGECVGAPGLSEVPSWARIQSYQTCEKFGHLFFFFGETPRYQIPDFREAGAEELAYTEPLRFKLNLPWYMVPCNAFDIQHYHVSHDRCLVEPPEIHQDGPFDMSIDLTLENVGRSVADGLARRVAGTVIDFNVSTTGGNLILVTSKLKRTKTFGFVNVVPLGPKHTLVVVLPMVKRSSPFLRSVGVEWLNKRLRRYVIHRFLCAETPQLDGIDISLNRLTAEDRELCGFLDLLQKMHGHPEQNVA